MLKKWAFWLLVVLVGAYISMCAAPAVPAPQVAAAVQVAPQAPHFAPCGARPCVQYVPLLGPLGRSQALLMMSWLSHINEEKADAGVIIIDSPGGDFEAAQAIVQTMRESHVKLHCVVNGMAASAAFWLLQVCDERAATIDSMLLAHEPRTIAKEDTVLTMPTLKEVLSDLAATNDVIAATCGPRMGLTPTQYKARISGADWHMSASGGLALHALDRVEHSVNEYLRGVKTRYVTKKATEK